ncbi:methyltransferase [Microbacterium sp.]|uniref:methyltransferase n=1 Tax=Microbacterium sp. TaxID=51671 RepID=UPI002E364122|nr:methyltransferase [Microbacterium sp.]HEX5729491.1 methyltransferase [Microbacterium sp.]
MTADDSAGVSASYLRRLLTNEFEKAFAVLAAAKLGVVDVLADGPVEISELAQRTDTHAPSLQRLMRALAGFDLVQQDADGRYSITALAEELPGQAPNSLRRQASWTATQEYLRSWSGLADSVRTGQPAFERIYGQPFFGYLDAHPRLAEIFNDVMTSSNDQDEVDAIVSGHDFGRYRKVVDVGGGRGAILASILHRHPDVFGVLHDSPQVIDNTEPVFDELVAANRATKMPSDFFKSVPSGGDAYVLKYILHDWDDAAAVKILTNCRQAMAAGASVLLVELIRPPGKQTEAVSQLDLTMLVFLHGRERSEAEYAELLDRADLQLVRTTQTAFRYSILEAIAR